MQSVYLEDLRIQAGMTPTQVLVLIRCSYPDIAPKQRSGVVHWEKQGILDFRVVDALSVIYNQPVEVVKAASLASRKRFHERPKKVTKKVSLVLT